MAFLAGIPSEHCYWRPKHSDHWHFAWLSTDHSFITDRFSGLFRNENQIFPLEESSAILHLFEAVIEEACRMPFPDLYTIEADLIRWAIAVDRHIHNLRYPPIPRERLLTGTRAFVLNNIHRSIGVRELAEHHGMSRSHFSHHFKSVTSLSPSEYILNIRLDAVLNLLKQKNFSLKEIASAAGFADATHLGKCFQRKYHLTPGNYRKRF